MDFLHHLTAKFHLKTSVVLRSNEGFPLLKKKKKSRSNGYLERKEKKSCPRFSRKLECDVFFCPKFSFEWVFLGFFNESITK